MNSLGYTFFGDSVYRISVLVPHSASSVGIEMFGENLQGIGDESWGIDDIRVTFVP